MNIKHPILRHPTPRQRQLVLFKYNVFFVLHRLRVDTRFRLWSIVTQNCFVLLDVEKESGIGRVSRATRDRGPRADNVPSRRPRPAPRALQPPSPSNNMILLTNWPFHATFRCNNPESVKHLSTRIVAKFYGNMKKNVYANRSKCK